MDLVAGAMGNLAPKLLQLLQDEYKVQKGLKKKIQFLSDELESIHAALRKVAGVPPDQLDEQVKIWARQVREASYDMEDIIDTFLVRVEGCSKPDPSGNGTLTSAVKRMSKLFTRPKLRHDIASAIKDIKEQLQVVAERRTRYRVDEIVSKPAASSEIDPRLQAMYQEVTHLVGIEEAMSELISMLTLRRGQVLNKKLKIVSVLGIGGLGKTTLAKAVYDEWTSQFDCGAFVSVGRNPDLKKVFRDILIKLDKDSVARKKCKEHKYAHNEISMWDESQLIDELQHFIGSMRYFIVIDDIWEKQIWEIIRLAFKDKNNGSRIILTTRKSEVTGSEVYMPKALSNDNAKRLFHTRIFGGVGKCPYNEVDEVSDKILKKCGGIPLAIITMASLLVGKSMGQWLEVCESTGFQDKDTMSILSLSYYDLPLHLRTCLLYLSAFPEDHIIDKNSLIWRWIAEGFVQKKQEGIGLFEVGEGYFNDLVNRSLIQAVESKHNGIIHGCRVHDMVLDLLRYLSIEENFFTVLGNDEGTSSISSARRLAHQKSTAHAHLENNMDAMEKMRSLIAFRYSDDKEIPFWRFELLRVIYLEGVYMKSWHNAKNLGNLLHLRCLGFKDTDMPELPKEIGALKFLQTLHLVRNVYIKELPSSVGQLTNLVCLHAWGSISWWTGIPIGIIKKLTFLEELDVHCKEDKYDKYKGQFKELSSLSKLRVLTIKVGFGMNQSMLSDLLQSVGDLDRIESIKLEGYGAWSSLCGATFDAVMVPRRLRHFLVGGLHTFSRFPSCIDPSSHINLTHLELNVISMDEQSMQILGGLPELCHLVLDMKSTVTVTSIAVDGCFQKLRVCKFFSSTVLFLLNEDSTVSFTLWNGEDDIPFGSRKKGECTGAPTIMPNLQELSFKVDKFSRKYEGIYGNLGLNYLASLQKLTVVLDYAYCYCEAYMTEAETGLRHAIDLHPRHPALIFIRINEERAHRMWALSKKYILLRDGSGYIKVFGDS